MIINTGDNHPRTSKTLLIAATIFRLVIGDLMLRQDSNDTVIQSFDLSHGIPKIFVWFVLGFPTTVLA